MSKARKNRVMNYIANQLKEASTWRGIILVLTASGCYLDPAKQEAIITAGLFLAGAIGAAFPDRAKPKKIDTE